MIIYSVLVIGVLVALSGGQPQSTCKDLDTNACIIFNKANPSLCNDQNFAYDTCQRFCGNCPLDCYMCPTPILDPYTCNTTASCGDGETCMTKHHVTKDGRHEYILMCGAKDICEGASLGFNSVQVVNTIIGKRQKQKDTDSHQRYNRDVSISCCDTDFCNMPMTTTTSPPTSPGPFPYGCNRDVVFVLDASGSVGSSNFKHAIDFIKAIVNQLDIGPTKAQVSMVTFSSHTNVNWFLNKYSTKPALLHAINNNISYSGGTTHTNQALSAVENYVLVPTHGDRPMAKNVVIVITDGQSNDKVSTIKEAQKLHAISDDVISIAIGSGINAQEIQAIATDNHHVFDLHSYSALNTIFNNLMQIICNA